VGDQGGILQIVKLKRRRTRLGELNHVLYRLLHNYMIESMCVFLNLYYWIENAEFWKFSRNRLAGCS